MLKLIVVCILNCVVLWMDKFAVGSSNLNQPNLQFLKEPSYQVNFANTKGVTIECSAQGNPIPTINWTMADGSSVSYVAGLREVTAKGNLVLKSFKPENFRLDVHVAVYRCVASNNIGKIQSRDVNVQGVVLQTHDVQVYDTYVIEKNTAVFKCHIPPVLKSYLKVQAWIKNDNLLIQQFISESPNEKYAMIPTGELHIHLVSLEESGSKYKCKTVNSFTGETQFSSSGQLFVTESQGIVPPKILDTPDLVRVYQGISGVLPCVPQGNPVPSVTWFKKTTSTQHKLLETGRRFINATSALIIHDTVTEDEGTYICEAISEAGRSHLDVKLNVGVPLSVNIQPSMQTAKSSEKVVFKCEASGQPLQDIRWLHNGNLITNAAGNYLTIDNVDILSRGIYQCLIRNDDEMVQASAELRISEIIPYFEETFPENVVQPGNDVSLNCTASGIPAPVLSWTIDDISLKNSSRLQINFKKHTGGRVSSNLLIRAVNVEDGGLYSCIAANKAGQIMHYSRINVPGQLGMRTVNEKVAVSGSRMYLNCPYFGYPVHEIIWEKDGTILPVNLVQSVFENGTLITEDVMKTADAGEYKCYARNSLGDTVEGNVNVAVLVPPKIVPFEFQDELLREGMRARLQCVISEGDLPLNATWLKDGRPIPSDLGVSIRILDEFSSILTISSIMPSHNGKYTCVASNRAATVTYTADLSVNVAPKIVPFHFGDLQSEGSPARVVCGLQEGDAPVYFSWLHDGVPVITDSSISIYEVDGLSSILSIISLSANQSGTYTCVAKNGAGVAQYSAVLYVNVPPKIVPFYFQEDNLIEGLLARVSCVVSRGDVPLKLLWEKDGVEIPNGSLGVQIKSFDDHSSILSISAVTTKHNGLYTCMAQNEAGLSRHTAQLTVQVPPRWLNIPKDVSVLKDQSVILHCSAEGFPKPAITWKQGTDARQSGLLKLIINTENIHIHSNGTLVIKSVTSHDEGFYFCLASNGIGRGLSARVQLKINAPPFFKHSLYVFNATLHSEVQLSCLVQGDTPIKIVWYKDDKIIQEGQARHKIQTTNTASDALSLLIIHKTERSDNGKYHCVAQNKFGSNKTAFALTVIEPPDAPSGIKATSIGSRTVELFWKSSYNGNIPVKKYIIQYKSSKGTWDADATTMETANGEPSNSIVSNLQPATTYLFRFFAENDQGASPSSEILHVTTTEDAPAGPPREVRVETLNTETFKVMWKVPDEHLWNGKILGYYVGYKEVDTEDPYLFKTLVTPDPLVDNLFVQISGLKQFTKYAVTVQAYNGHGKGPESDTVIVMTSEGAPSLPPHDIHCTALTSTSIHVTWAEPPSDSINGILRGYKVLYKPASDWFEDLAENFNITLPTSTTLNHLEKFTNYSIQVLAMTKAGDGPKSNPVFCKTLDDVPGPPINIKAIATSDDSVIVAWKTPENPNGVVKSYAVYWRDVSNSQDVSMHTVTAQLHHYEVTRLKKGHRYEFSVAASTLAGEGQKSKTVIQVPGGPTVPAKVVSFEDKIITAWKSDISLPCHAVGIPEPKRSWTFQGKHLLDNEMHKILSDGSLSMKELSEENAGDYVCAVHNDFGDDNITYAIIVLGPPSSPEVEVTGTTSNAIEIQWKTPTSKMSRIKGYTLHIKKDVGEWNEVTVGADVRSYRMNSLDCGTRYEIFISAFNKIGLGAPSDVLIMSTNGSVPIAPSKSELIEESSNSVTLHLNTWKNNGCPIQYFIVEYAPKSSNEWILVSTTVKPEQRRLVIPSLRSSTWHGLRITAHNSAGSSIANYDFATLTPAGATIIPELQADAPNEEINGIVATLNFYVIVPIVCTIIILLAIFAMACMCVTMRKRNQVPQGNRMSVVSTELKRGDSSESFSYMQRGTLNRHSTGTKHGEDLAPYATFQLANQAMMNTLRNKRNGPPLPPSRFENCPTEGMPPMMNQHFFPPATSFIPDQGQVETTFVFPNPPPDTGLENITGFTPGYSNEAMKFT